MKNIFLVLLLASFIVGCSDSGPLEYEDDILKLSLPSGWGVSAVENQGKTGQKIIIANGGFIVKGLFVIIMFDVELDRRTLLETFQKEMASVDMGPVETNSFFEEIENDGFGIYETLSSNFNMEVLKNKSKGQLHVFHASNKTIVLQLQSFSGKEEIFDAGVAALENSLRING